MNNTTNVAALTVLVVIAGQWQKGNKLPIEVIIGGVIYTLILSAMNSGAPKLARNFAILVLISAIFIYAVPVFTSLGLLEESKKKKDKRP